MKCLLTLVILLSVVAMIPHSAAADLVLDTGNKIMFSDGTTQSSALASGLSLPAGHGGTNNTLSGTSAYIGGGDSNAVTDDYGTVGGGTGNQAGDAAGDTTDKPDTTVGGGAGNLASGEYATVAGGYENMATGDNGSVIAGGNGNTSTGRDSALLGGYHNNATGESSDVCGGSGNTASGGWSAIGGGFQNHAEGENATVPGGIQNDAYAANSFAAGTMAQVGSNDVGTFLYADSSAFPFTSITTNEFAVRATGGVRFVTAIDGTFGTPTVSVTIDGAGNIRTPGSLNPSSDRNAKENFEAVDTTKVLERVLQLPIETWNYKHEDASVRHMGTMAQDFAAAFHVGIDDKHIATVDADGVALAAIQGLDKRLEAERAETEAELAAKDKQIEELETRLAAIEKKLAR